MEVTEKGKYEVLKEFKTRNAISITIIKKGEILNVSQIDDMGHRIMAGGLLDWICWDLPVKKI